MTAPGRSPGPPLPRRQARIGMAETHCRWVPARRRRPPPGAPAHRADDRVQPLRGLYEAPPLRVGDRASCLFRDCDVVVTGWTDARISWPRCRPLDVRRSHPSLLVNEDLARAIRQESAAALTYW